MNKSNKAILVLIVALLIILFYVLYDSSRVQDPKTSTPQVSQPASSTPATISAPFIAKVNYIDVGQADSIYIDLPNDVDILIDGGNVADGPTVAKYLESQGVDSLELVIATHPHEDHIGGLPYIIDHFSVNAVLDSGKTANTDLYKDYVAAIKTERCGWISDSHQCFDFGDASLRVYTGNEKWTNLNDYSVICLLAVGEIKFLFNGDAGREAEETLLNEVKADVLKVSHHGSSSATSDLFLSWNQPEIAIISVGTGNKYHHPAKDTLFRLKDIGTKVYRTDIDGDIVISTDGKSINIVQ